MKLYEYIVKDIENERLVVAETSIEAIEQFINLFYGGVVYSRNIDVEKVGEFK